jgi:hypothetical protein
MAERFSEGSKVFRQSRYLAAVSFLGEDKNSPHAVTCQQRTGHSVAASNTTPCETLGPACMRNLLIDSGGLEFMPCDTGINAGLRGPTDCLFLSYDDCAH